MLEYPDYTYWVSDDPPPPPIYLRRYPGGCDILRDGRWEPIDPEEYGGEVDPWASKIGNGDVVRISLSDVPVRD